MIFKINGGNMESLLKRKFVTEQEKYSPIFYFEDSEEIYLYQAKNSIILCSEAPLSSIDIKAFKMEYLTDAIELVEKPNNSVKLEINQV